MRPANKNDTYRFMRERPRHGERVFIHPAVCNAVHYVRLKDLYLQERG